MSQLTIKNGVTNVVVNNNKPEQITDNLIATINDINVTSVNDGWISELLIDDDANVTSQRKINNNNNNKKMKMKNDKIMTRRKCLSVGPIMLTPSTQLIRKIDGADGEERYHYIVPPLLPLKVTPSLDIV